jgi:hypothetical protein
MQSVRTCFGSQFELFDFYFSGMYKNKSTNKCEFCPANTYSNGTLNECLACKNDLSLLPGLYYQNWNELPIYLNTSYLSFDDSDNCMSIFYFFLVNFFYLFKQLHLLMNKVGLVLIS